MGDVKLTPRQTAALLNKLDDSARSVDAARAQLLGAMAERHRDPADEEIRRSTVPRRRKKR